MPLELNHRSYCNLVARFCDLAEGNSGASSARLIAVRDALVELYQASLHMPDIVGERFRDVPERLPFDEYRRVKERIGTVVESDYFLICFHPFRTPAEEPVCASLSDGLADIWRDLKRGLLALEEDEEKWAAAVFWDWKFSFETHWGDHAVDCIWAIHKLLRDSAEDAI
jgi:hypothetical protein